MSRKRFSPEQIIVKLREAEIIESKGLTQVEAAKKLEICEQTLIRWRKEYGGLRVDQAKRFKELEKENTRLKRLVADRIPMMAITISSSMRVKPDEFL